MSLLLLLTVLWLLLGSCATVLVAGLCAFNSGTDDEGCCGYGEPCVGEGEARSPGRAGQLVTR